MEVTFNPNKEAVEKLREALRKNDGYCPCKREKIPENKCMCKEFKDQIKNPDFEGFCHCLLYYKKK